MDLKSRLRLLVKKIACRVKSTSELINLIRKVRTDNGKYVTPTEFHTVLFKLGIFMSKVESDEIFTRFDSDRSGSIDPEEFSTWIMCSDFAKEISTKSRFAVHGSTYTKVKKNQPRYMSNIHTPSKLFHDGSVAWQKRNAKIAALDTRRERMAVIRAAQNTRLSTSQQEQRNAEIKEKQKMAFKWGSAPSSAERRLCEALRQSYESLEKMAMKIMKYDVYIDEEQLFKIINSHGILAIHEFFSFSANGAHSTLYRSAI